MFKKPIFIAISASVLAAIPLYFLSTQQFQLSSNNFPLVLLSLFILLLVTAYWSQTTATEDDNDSYQVDPNSPREGGNVKWFNANKGFGFITRDAGDDIFVHFRSIRGEGHRVLRDGQRVEFAVSQGEKGLQADDVAAA